MNILPLHLFYKSKKGHYLFLRENSYIENYLSRNRFSRIFYFYDLFINTPRKDILFQLIYLKYKQMQYDLIIVPHILELDLSESERMILIQRLMSLLSVGGQLLCLFFNPQGWFYKTRMICLDAKNLFKNIHPYMPSDMRSIFVSYKMKCVVSDYYSYLYPLECLRYSTLELMGNRWWPTKANLYVFVVEKE